MVQQTVEIPASAEQFLERLKTYVTGSGGKIVSSKGNNVTVNHKTSRPVYSGRHLDLVVHYMVEESDHGAKVMFSLSMTDFLFVPFGLAVFSFFVVAIFAFVHPDAPDSLGYWFLPLIPISIVYGIIAFKVRPKRDIASLIKRLGHHTG